MTEAATLFSSITTSDNPPASTNMSQEVTNPYTLPHYINKNALAEKSMGGVN